MTKIVCFGEVLWDVFPNGDKKIGGAPLNVALRLSAFQNEVAMVSAVGQDDNGKIILDYLEKNKVSSSFIQKKEDFNTGEVSVKLNKKGSATYDIVYPSAWDKIELTEDLKSLVTSADALVFGSLVTRDEISKNTLWSLLRLSSFKVFDVNLRPPHYSKDILIKLMEQSDFIKFNDEELYEIAGYLKSKYNALEQNLLFIAEKTNTSQICVTKGEHGAVLLINGKLYYNSGYKIKVKDTVGAGDSFLGTLLSQLLNGVNPQKAIDVACGVGALVAQSEGANPKLSKDEINAFINP
ncbi:fructokinase [Hyunsoonleella jejuensis]|uniref:Fructokinase n=1 Tax=Hyunsoonleella jejuensis TaxID=419940 RepID=A0A1H9JGU6_9FLAO|nr:carbohydrate kinase [Hyunsoonleella jejuensis]SEQ85755.1 fructokinase [Hyunsoonleella jejuensis]